jgi:hypothetical protein
VVNITKTLMGLDYTYRNSGRPAGNGGCGRVANVRAPRGVRGLTDASVRAVPREGARAGPDAEYVAARVQRAGGASRRTLGSGATVSS